ncbi:hypothetical protein KUCAC02_003831, partial [Chaenocephalus aceratus]
ATIHDTVMWDPSTCSRPSDSSTTGHQQSWSEVVRRSLLNGETSPPRLRLQNRFTTLRQQLKKDFGNMVAFDFPE